MSDFGLVRFSREKSLAPKLKFNTIRAVVGFWEQQQQQDFRAGAGAPSALRAQLARLQLLFSRLLYSNLHQLVPGRAAGLPRGSDPTQQCNGNDEDRHEQEHRIFEGDRNVSKHGVVPSNLESVPTGGRPTSSCGCT